MSHSIFDALTGVALEGSGALTVQQLLDSPGFIQGTVTISGAPPTATSNTHPCGQLASAITNPCTTISEGVPLDDDDVFQCGRCKQKFSSLDLFMVHKRDQCSGKNRGLRVMQTTTSPPQPAPPDPRNFESDSSSLANQIHVQVQPHQAPQVSAGFTSSDLPSPGTIIVGDAELLPFTIEATQVLPLTGSLQTTNFIPASSGSKVMSSAVSPLLTTTSSMNTSLDVGSGLSPTQTLTTIVGGVEETTEGESGCNVCVSNHVEVTLEEKDDVACYNHEFFHGGMAKTATSKNDPMKSKPKHKCSFCGKLFSKNFDLQQHLRSHTGEKPFQCVVCGRAFTQKSNVKKHMTTHRVWPFGSLNDTLPKEPIKKLVLPSGAVSNGDVVSRLELLGESSVKEEVLVDASYVCQFCGYSQSSYVELRSHMKVHADQKVYRCIQKNCDLAFEDIDSFLDHIRTHDRDLEYRCHTCSKVFTSLNTLGSHQYEHLMYPQPKKPSGTTFIRCTKCMNKYASTEALEHHLRTSSHHYPCKLCSKVFMSERLLRRHLHVHGTVNGYPCATCSKEFKSEYSLKLHQLIHTGEKPYECSLCKTAFNRKDKLKRHMLIHEAKKFKCPFRASVGCMREFSRPDKLRVHMLTHAGGRARSRRKKGRGRSNNMGRKDQQVKTESHDSEDNKCSICNLPHKGNDHKCLVVDNTDVTMGNTVSGEASSAAAASGRMRPVRQAVVRRARDQFRSNRGGRKRRGGMSIQTATSQLKEEEEEEEQLQNPSLQLQETTLQEDEAIIPVHSVEGISEMGSKGDTQNVEIIYIPFSLPLTRPMQAELIRAISNDEECHVTSEILEGGPTITLDGTASSLLVGNDSMVPLVSPSSVQGVETIQTDSLHKDAQDLQVMYNPAPHQLSSGNESSMVETALTGSHIQTTQLDHEDSIEESQLSHSSLSHLDNCILPDQT